MNGAKLPSKIQIMDYATGIFKPMKPIFQKLGKKHLVTQKKKYQTMLMSGP